MPATTPALQSLHELVRQRIFAGAFRARFFATPAVALIGCFFLFLDPAPWRIAMVLAPVTTILVVSWVEARSTQDIGTPRFVANVAVTAGCQLVLIFATGGIASPILPALILFVLGIGIATPRSFSLPFLLVLQIPAIWLYAVVHTQNLVPGIVIPVFEGLYAESGTPGAGAYVVASIFTIVMIGASKIGSYVRIIGDEMVERYVVEQERALNMHADQAKTLTALSAEIAHELKNPLASVKGLAALVRKDVDGVTAERLDVLRREVDRMQGILAELLDYSRPLIPLQAEDVDVTALAREVAALHEGIARQRGVTIEVSPEGAIGHRLDPRKLRVVLINLVQNAIDASPAGAVITIDLAHAKDAGLTLRVLDRGAGIDPEIAERLFTVGATTKAKGNGLGLAMARGLARQHGGELLLLPRKGGGASAELSLPAEPPASELAAA